MEFFSLTHNLTLITLVLCAVLCIGCYRRGQIWPRYVLAFVCLVSFSMNQAMYLGLDYNLPWENILPFHLCDIVAVTAGFALLTGRPILCELTYCWGLAGTFQALLTPNLSVDFPEPIFFSFFIHHGSIVIAALFLPLAMNWRPRDGIVLRIFLWNQVYFIGAFLINIALDANFGFLMDPPAAGSPMDHFGPWPWYLIPLQLIAIMVMTMLVLPFSKSINIWRVPQNQAKPSL